MLRSIRARLVLSYVLLTLLTVSLVGALTFSLVRRRVARQELASLRENAEAVAREAQPLMWPVPQPGELQELAKTASFLGDARVRIWDAERRVVADSGLDADGDAFLWVLPPLEWRVRASGEDGQPFLIVVPGGRQRMPHLEDPFDLFEELPPETAYTYVRRWEELWGSRFNFHTLAELTPAPRGEAFPDAPRGGEWILERPRRSAPESGAPVLEVRSEAEQALRSDREVVVPVAPMEHAGAASAPLGYVEISGGPDLGSSVLRTIGRSFWIAAGGTALLAVVVGLVVSQGLSAPVRELTAAAVRMGGGDLSARAAVSGGSEIGQLAGQFNHMAERLEASFGELAAERDALRRFIADASHELRTPITALKSFNDLLQGAAAGDPEARTEFLAESQVQIERLEWITHNLLDLSRLDAGLAALDLAEHDVGELIEAAAALFRRATRDKGIDLALRQPQPPLSLRCDRARIEVALSNLLDNALKFTPSGGRVQVGAVQRGESVRFWVRDTGCGIAPEDQPHVFERFYRGRSVGGRHVRGQGPDRQGSGLGLAIVQSVVLAHGGRVWVKSEPGTGSLFVIEVPREAGG